MAKLVQLAEESCVLPLRRMLSEGCVPDDDWLAWLAVLLVMMRLVSSLTFGDRRRCAVLDRSEVAITSDVTNLLC